MNTKQRIVSATAPDARIKNPEVAPGIAVPSFIRAYSCLFVVTLKDSIRNHERTPMNTKPGAVLAATVPLLKKRSNTTAPESPFTHSIRVNSWLTQKLRAHERMQSLKIEQCQKINGLELSVQRGRTTDFRAERQVSAQQFGNLHRLAGQVTE